MDLNEVSVFIKVIQAGSFSAAAKQLAMPNSTVSSKVSSLERRLGITLIQRTTRKLHVTPAGEIYFRRCIAGLEQIVAAEAELAAGKAEPHGVLKITAPVELGSSILPSLISRFNEAYPSVALELILTDRRVDLLGEGVDLAIRAGVLKDSSLVAKKLGMAYFAPFASPRYLERAPAPRQPRDLRQHKCIQFTNLGVQEWKLSGPRGSAVVPMSGRMVVNDLNMVKTLAVSGAGVALLPTFFCYPEVRAARLVRVLPEWRTIPNPVHFVYPGSRYVNPALSAFIAFAAEELKESLRNFEL